MGHKRQSFRSWVAFAPRSKPTNNEFIQSWCVGRISYVQFAVGHERQSFRSWVVFAPWSKPIKNEFQSRRLGLAPDGCDLLSGPTPFRVPSRLVILPLIMTHQFCTLEIICFVNKSDFFSFKKTNYLKPTLLPMVQWTEFHNYVIGLEELTNPPRNSNLLNNSNFVFVSSWPAEALFSSAHCVLEDLILISSAVSKVLDSWSCPPYALSSTACAARALLPRKSSWLPYCRAACHRVDSLVINLLLLCIVRFPVVH